MNSWFSQTPAANNNSIAQPEPPAKKGFFDNVKSMVTSTPNTTSTPVPNEDPESTSLIGGFSQKLQKSLSAGAIITKSKSFMQGTTESMQTSINLAKNLPYIIVLCVGGTFFMFIAFMFLPTIIIFPEKFSFSFAMGSMCFMGAISLLRDPKTFFMSFLKGGKLFYTICYIVSLVGTFYFSMMAQSKIFALLFAIGQIVTLLWLIGSSVPGGTRVMGTIQSAVIKCCKSCTMMIFRSSTSSSSSSSGLKSFLPI